MRERGGEREREREREREGEIGEDMKECISEGGRERLIGMER